MPTFKVIVTGRIPAPEQASTPPPSAYPLTAYPQQHMQEVDLIWPAICPCCGAPVETTHRLQLSKAKQSWTGFVPTLAGAWEVPYCEGCLHHQALKQQRPTSSVIIELVTVITALVAVFSILPSSPILAGVIFVAIVLAGIFGNARALRDYEERVVRPVMGQACSAPGPALVYQGWNEDRTRHVFQFDNQDYAQTFAELNHAAKVFQVK